VTEIRGPCYSVVGARYLTDVLEMMGAYGDSVKFAGGSFCLMCGTLGTTDLWGRVVTSNPIGVSRSGRLAMPARRTEQQALM
jgi:phosphosulfolactate synthase (CoM biosynthesis protein A)